jgi:hypothetical protein
MHIDKAGHDDAAGPVLLWQPLGLIDLVQCLAQQVSSPAPSYPRSSHPRSRGDAPEAAPHAGDIAPSGDGGEGLLGPIEQA